MPETDQPKPNDKPATLEPSAEREAMARSDIPPSSAPQPMREILDKLMKNANQLSETDRQLGATILALGFAARDPAQLDFPQVQHAVASAAQDFERATGKPLDLSASQRAEVTRLTASATPDPSSATKNDAAGKPAPPTQPPLDPIHEVLTKLVEHIGQLPDSAKGLGNKIRELDNDARDPVRFNQKAVRHEVAYVAQDFEKAAGRQLDLTPSQRAEMTKLAGSAPGLENDGLIALLLSTAKIGDSGLVRDIRRYSGEVGKANNQNTPDIQSHVENYENRVRQAQRATEPASEVHAGAAPPKAEQAGSPGNTASSGARDDQQRPQNNPDRRGPPNGAGAEQMPPAQTAVLRGGILDTLTAVLRGNGRPNNAPWDPQPTPFGDRLNAFQAKVDARDQDRVIGRVENSARAAVNALDGFRSTEGATIMSRIQTAARAEPGGMASVLSEMRQGGKFGDLRKAFDKALIDDKGFAQAYDRAATALARYGEGREKVEQIIDKRPDAANLTAKFEQFDSQIGERASNIPSRNEGKNMLDDISKTVAEIIQRAAEKVRAIFSASPTASPSPAPAP